MPTVPASPAEGLNVANRSIGHIKCPIGAGIGEVRRYKDSARGKLYWSCNCCGQIRPALNQSYIIKNATFYRDAGDLLPPSGKVLEIEPPENPVSVAKPATPKPAAPVTPPAAPAAAKPATPKPAAPVTPKPATAPAARKPWGFV